MSSSCLTPIRTNQPLKSDIMVKYTSTVLASAILATTVLAEPVCKVVTETVTGDWYWVADPTWGDWSSSTASSSSVDPTWADWTSTTTSTSADPTWGDWTTTSSKKTTTTTPAKKATTTTWVDPTWLDWTTTTTTTTTSVDPTWLDWTTTTTTTTTKATTTSVDPTWLDWTSSTEAATTAAPTSGKPTTTTTTTTTTTVAPAASCPASNGEEVEGGGSCGCEFSVNCGVHADTSTNPTFFQKDSGAAVDSLAECLALCDNNDKCTATIWCDDASSCGSDYHICWQTNGLGGVAGTGYGQISYKGSCSGSCSSSYEG
ncbi:hypothetical protein LTR72_004143 [Exophiala xenobiotica]|nr:hypothetical protein LTR72_004143 [Exophiala xenobiotica]KAK5494456.1 hypothetical protein LTR55_002843 [Exophiala xenobiotica]